MSKDKFTRNVLQNLNKAAQQANSKDIQYLVNCGSRIDDRKSITGEAPIHKVVLSHEETKTKEDTLKSIIEDCNANVNNLDSNGWSALHHACYTGDHDSAKTLIEAGANINAFSNQNRTPMHFAAANNHYEVLSLLIDYQADIEATDDLGCTPLHLACKKGAFDCMLRLLDAKAEIYCRDHRLWNPLHYASYNGHSAIVYELLKFEADEDKLRHFRSSQNKLPLNLAKDDQTKWAFNNIWRACKEGDLDLVRILLRESNKRQNRRSTELPIDE